MTAELLGTVAKLPNPLALIGICVSHFLQLSGGTVSVSNFQKKMFVFFSVIDYYSLFFFADVMREGLVYVGLKIWSNTHNGI